MDWSDPETWRLINSFAPWLSALGTFAAVVVSLYLAFARDRLKVRVTATKKRLVAMYQKFGEGESVVDVTVTNLSGRPVNITTLYWRARWQRGAFVQIPSTHPLSAQLPLELPAHGGTGSFIFPEATYHDPRQAEMLRKMFGGRLARFKARLVRVGVSTTVFRSFEGKLDRGIRKWFVALVEKLDNSPGEEAPLLSEELRPHKD